MPIITRAARSVNELDLTEIAFTDGDPILDSVSNLSSVLPVIGQATSTGRLKLQGSRSLVFTDFGFPEGITVQGIELELRVDRLARVQDRVIQLWLSQAIGVNKFNLSSADRQLYGGDQDLWSLPEGFNSWSAANFGVVIDLQPHTQYPSNNLVYVRSLALTLYTS